MSGVFDALMATRWAPIRKVAAAFVAGLVGWGGWAIWIAAGGELDLGPALRAGALAALPVVVAYLTPSRPAEASKAPPGEGAAPVPEP